MSAAPSRRSADLERLRDEGYDVALVDGLLAVRGIPYATQSRTVEHGTLMVPLRMAGDATLPPDAHAVRWQGETPRRSTGEFLPEVNVGKL